MDKRPYFSKTVDELTELFENSKDKPRVLKALLKELDYRSRPKAKRLAKQVEECLAGQKPAEQIPLPRAEPAKPVEQATLPTAEQQAPKDEQPEAHAEPKRKKWWTLWLVALAVACCGYVYWQYGSSDPDNFLEINSQGDVHKEIKQIRQTMNDLKQ